MRGPLATFIIAALLSACAPQMARPPAATGQPPGSFPEQFYLQAIERRQPVYRVDAARSLLVLEVRRGGSFARAGHDHVVSSHDARGYVAPGAGQADLYFELDRLVVDEPALRAEAGFDTQPSEDDVAGTRRNMLEKVLHAGTYPFVLVRVTGADAELRGTPMNVAITLHGTTRDFKVPVQINATADEIQANGRMALSQTDFGIVPYSILNGAIQVQDELNLRFVIVARRVER